MIREPEDLSRFPVTLGIPRGLGIVGQRRLSLNLRSPARGRRFFFGLHRCLLPHPATRGAGHTWTVGEVARMATMRHTWIGCGTVLVMVAAMSAPAAGMRYADFVHAYTWGNGEAGYDDPSGALGRPERMTGEGTDFPAQVEPMNPPWLATEIASIGPDSGELVLGFNGPVLNDRGDGFDASSSATRSSPATSATGRTFTSPRPPPRTPRSARSRSARMPPRGTRCRASLRTASGRRSDTSGPTA